MLFKAVLELFLLKFPYYPVLYLTISVYVLKKSYENMTPKEFIIPYIFNESYLIDLCYKGASIIRNVDIIHLFYEFT